MGRGDEQKPLILCISTVINTDFRSSEILPLPNNGIIKSICWAFADPLNRLLVLWSSTSCLFCCSEDGSAFWFHSQWRHYGGGSKTLHPPNLSETKKNGHLSVQNGKNRWLSEDLAPEKCLPPPKFWYWCSHCTVHSLYKQRSNLTHVIFNQPRVQTSCKQENDVSFFP